MRIEIPGYKTMDLKYLILDYNGTIAKDGIIPEKRKIIEQLGGKRCIAVGNGRNDLPMCRIAELSVGIIEAEGAYGRLIANVDICTRSIEEALDVLAMPKRMVATLRG
mgnify:CR=1 FL=1